MYLSSTVTADGHTSTAIKAHAQRVMCHALKFIAFVEKNNDLPFWGCEESFYQCSFVIFLYGIHIIVLKRLDRFLPDTFDITASVAQPVSEAVSVARSTEKS